MSRGTHPVRSICLAVLPDNLDNAHLQQLVHARDLVKHLDNPLHSLRHGAVRKEDKCIPLASRVGLGREECLDELWRIGNKMLEVTVDRVDGEHGVLPNVRVPVLETGTTDRDERLEDLNVLGELLQESERRPADVLVGMLLRTIQSSRLQRILGFVYSRGRYEWHCCPRRVSHKVSLTQSVLTPQESSPA